MKTWAISEADLAAWCSSLFLKYPEQDLFVWWKRLVDGIIAAHEAEKPRIQLPLPPGTRFR
jgi:hypothetical protein